MMTVEQLRQELPVTVEVAYFQTGTYGPTMDSVLSEVHDAMRAEAHYGPATPKGRRSHAQKEAKARSALASLLNAGEREVAITTNTSQAMQRVVRSIRLEARR